MISSVLSVFSTFLWLIALLPQQWQNFTTKSVDGLSPHFMMLWLLGDSCNLIGCFLTQQLPFQTFLAIYFFFNDIVLDFQYWYYRNDNKQRGYSQISLNESEHIISSPNNDKDYSATEVGNNSSITSTPIKIATVPMVVAVSLSSLSSVSALPITTEKNNDPFNIELVGLCFAWLCTIVYCCSRIPQLYHNYTRKSVDGISPLLFTFALLGNLTYSLSILSAEIPKEMTYSQFLVKELPYLIGSLGTVVFDAIYFVQREIYKSL